MPTVLTFDLSSETLDDGQPVTIVADGGTVYSNGNSLYIANNQQWTTPVPGAAQAPSVAQTPGAVAGMAAGSASRSAPGRRQPRHRLTGWRV
jgi:hypothetical protein